VAFKAIETDYLKTRWNGVLPIDWAEHLLKQALKGPQSGFLHLL